MAVPLTGPLLYCAASKHSKASWASPQENTGRVNWLHPQAFSVLPKRKQSSASVSLQFDPNVKYNSISSNRSWTGKVAQWLERCTLFEDASLGTRVRSLEPT